MTKATAARTLVIGNVMAQSAEQMNPTRKAFWAAFWYLLAVLLLLGGLGIWVPLALDRAVGIDAIATYVFAVIAPTVADLLVDLDLFKRQFPKVQRMFFFACVSLACVLAFLSLLREHKSWEWQMGILAMAMSLIIWLWAAMKSERFLPDPVKTASIGGDSPNQGGISGPGLSGA